MQEHWRAACAQDGHKPYQEPGAIADCQQHAVAGPKRIFFAREPVCERVARGPHLSPVQLQSAIEIVKGAAVILEEVEKGRGGEIWLVFQGFSRGEAHEAFCPHVGTG